MRSVSSELDDTAKFPLGVTATLRTSSVCPVSVRTNFPPTRSQTRTVLSVLPDTAVSEDTTLGLVMSDVRRVANGLDLAVAEGEMTADEASSISSEVTDVRERLAAVGVALGSNVSPEVLLAAQQYRQLSSSGSIFMAIAVLATALIALGYAVGKSNKDYRARNVVERGILAILIFAASIAILTTIGILFSLVFNTIEFFRIYPATEFFFSLEWAPSF